MQHAEHSYVNEGVKYANEVERYENEGLKGYLPLTTHMMHLKSRGLKSTRGVEFMESH